MNWDDLKIVLAIARAGSLTRAAEALEIDQSTAGRRLSALEAALGAVLFTRARTGFAPTEAGETAIARAAEIEHRAMLLRDAMTPEAEAVGLVRLEGGVWTTTRFAAVGAPALLRAHPRLDLRIVASTWPAPQTSGEASVSIWFEAAPRTGEFAVKLGETPYAIYARADADPAALTWLAHHTDTQTTHAPHRWARQALAGAASPRLMAADSMPLFECVRAGVGKALLPMCLGMSDPALTRLGAGAPELVRTMHIHAHPDTVQLRRVQALIETLRADFDHVFGTARAEAIAAA